uniref:Uncharacterized protein n=1 Tax=Lepeophtheirus salmonis TaxID=72036 RepID=A0A0K2TB84_LEPSM
MSISRPIILQTEISKKLYQQELGSYVLTQ